MFVSVYCLFYLCLEIGLKKKGLREFYNFITKRINDVCTCFECKVFKLLNYNFWGKRWRQNERFDENLIITLDTSEYTNNKIEVTRFAVTIPIVQINSIQ